MPVPHHMQSIPLPKFPMSAYNMQYDYKSSLNMGFAVPHYCEEVIPSDIAHIRTDLFMRLSPLTFPIMHRIKVRQNFFFVPDRLILGDDIQNRFFSGKGELKLVPWGVMLDSEPSQETIPAFLQPGNIVDYFGVQPYIQDIQGLSEVPIGIRNPLPFYMYHKIWSDWYADEIYDAEYMASISTAIDTYRDAILNSEEYITPSEYLSTLRPVSYSKDRFTSAQPSPERVGSVKLMNPLSVERIASGSVQSGYLRVNADGDVLDNGSGRLKTELDINELFDEMAVQRYLNSLNEFGNERYVEILAGQYGVISSDSRLQRAQWIGGSEMSVNISEVLQTSESTSESPLGAQAGRGIVSGRGRDIAFRSEEHGFIIGILSVVPDNGYASGSPRWAFKSDFLDFAIPRLNNIGEQAVFKGELFTTHDLDTDSDLTEFGYQPQYDEYRSHPSVATGDFRNEPLLQWHLNRKFASVPPLNENFIHVDWRNSMRIFNNQDVSPKFYVDAFHNAVYVRPIAKHPVAGKIL